MQANTTPVPNALFDVHLKQLKSSELKVLLVIIRKTLGWADRRSVGGRKEIDWISSSQLQLLTGSSRRAITSATESLITKRLIEVLDERGNLLDDPNLRKGKQRLYYRTSSAFASGDNLGIDSVYPSNSDSPHANFAQDLSKKITDLAQKMRMTKETLQN